jgi:hypothetical protein
MVWMRFLAKAIINSARTKTPFFPQMRLTKKTG